VIKRIGHIDNNENRKLKDQEFNINQPTISIIIPTYNEADNIGRLLEYLLAHRCDLIKEIIVVDGGSTDQTVDRSRQYEVEVLNSPHKGRASQMNYGASKSSGNILYFVHADTIPPSTFATDIVHELAAGYPLGCFRFLFDSPRKLLKVNSYFTRFDKIWCRGGDQTLFVKRQLFEELNGYRDDHKIMEEYDFIIRARKEVPFKIIPKDVIVSARKYDHNGYLRVQVANLVVFNMYRFGASQERMVKTYRRLLKK